MDIVFTRTGRRRYRVDVWRRFAPDLVLDPAGGFDRHLPRDLMYFLVESHWVMPEGIFGQLANGGDAGTFCLAGQSAVPWWQRRWRRKKAISFVDAWRCKKLANLADAAWRAKYGKNIDIDACLTQTAATDAQMAVLLSRMTEASQAWTTLDIGQSMLLTWPGPERRARRDKVA